MAKINWVDIKKEDVFKAIEKFELENPEYPEPRSTFLVYGGKKYPAKHIRGMTYAVHFGVEISKSVFGGGMETARFFERLGFEMAYSGASEHELKPVKAVKKEQSISVVEKKVAPIVEAKSEPIVENKQTTDKITILSKQVIEQKNALQLILNKMFDGDIVCEKTYPWLKTPNVIADEYKPLYNALSSYRGDTAFAKKNVLLRCDFVCEKQKLIIEYDERQHFSEARKVALESFENIPLCFNRGLWIKACNDIGAKDNAPKNRDEIRAYYDSTRDIECYKHGYRLVRIMHGQIDFEETEAGEKLKAMIPVAIPKEKGTKAPIHKPSFEKNNESEMIKVCMYLQTDELKCQTDYDKHMKILKKSDVDLIIFPEFCYFPEDSVMRDVDMGNIDDLNRVYDKCLKVSKNLGKAVVLSSFDCYGSIYSVFANAFAGESETKCKYYMKHTMTECSIFEFENYPELVEEGLFDSINFKDFRIGMTICYDCNHALFSRMYELCGGVDLIVNSTGGNVVFDKWFKYNKARAIENSCYSLVTMGGDGYKDNPHCYVYGFNANGGEIKPVNLNGSSNATNVPGGLYVYEVMKNPGAAEVDDSNMLETANKNWQLEVPVGNVQALIDKADKIANDIYMHKVGNDNVILCLVDGMSIMKAEKVLSLLYSPEIKKHLNRKYVIVNRHGHIDETLFKEKLSTILKVRSMENFCAVVLESENITKCYQCGKNRTAQVVRATDGFFGIDLDRTTGPEAIWKNKQGMKIAWRKHYEWLVNKAADLYS